MVSVLEITSSEDVPLDCMVEAIDAFVAQRISLGELVGRLAAYNRELRTAPPRWRTLFLNLWTSLEVIHSETRAHRRDLTEMELRFVLSLSLELRDMIGAVRGVTAEPLAI